MRDHTAIIDRSRCFREAVSHREAQPTPTNVADVERKLLFCVLSLARLGSFRASSLSDRLERKGYRLGFQ